MKWAEFKQQDVGEIIDTVQAWEKGEDMDGAAEFARDFLDNGLFRFEDGSVPEGVTDAAIAMGDAYLAKLGAKLGSLVGAGLHAKPLAALPF